MHQCCHQIRIAGMNFYRTRQCKNFAIEQIDGKWLCKLHTPERMKLAEQNSNKKKQSKMKLKFKIKLALKVYDQRKNDSARHIK